MNRVYFMQYFWAYFIWHILHSSCSIAILLITSLSILMKSSPPWYLYQYKDAVGLVRALRSSVVGFGKPALPPIFVAYARNPSVQYTRNYLLIFMQLTLKQEVKEMWQRLCSECTACTACAAELSRVTDRLTDRHRNHRNNSLHLNGKPEEKNNLAVCSWSQTTPHSLHYGDVLLIKVENWKPSICRQNAPDCTKLSLKFQKKFPRKGSRSVGTPPSQTLFPFRASRDLCSFR